MKIMLKTKKIKKQKINLEKYKFIFCFKKKKILLNY